LNRAGAEGIGRFAARRGIEDRGAGYGGQRAGDGIRSDRHHAAAVGLREKGFLARGGEGFADRLAEHVDQRQAVDLVAIVKNRRGAEDAGGDRLLVLDRVGPAGGEDVRARRRRGRCRSSRESMLGASRPLAAVEKSSMALARKPA
jgi:hypothetical protein